MASRDELFERLMDEHPDASPEELASHLLLVLLRRFELLDAVKELG